LYDAILFGSTFLLDNLLIDRPHQQSFAALCSFAIPGDGSFEHPRRSPWRGNPRL
jgi:hypothetical protein